MMTPHKGKGRLISRSISQSESFAALSNRAAVLFLMLIPHFNVFGKMQANPEIIKERVCPEIPYLPVAEVEKALREISDYTDVKYFCENGMWYLHALKFDEHQATRLRIGRRGKDLLPSYPGYQRELVKNVQDNERVGAL